MMNFLWSARFHAVLSAYLSIAAGVTIAILAFAAREPSMSLYGAAFMGLIDSIGSILVLMVYHTCTEGMNHEAQSRVEAKYSFIIGGLMLVMGLYLLSDSTVALATGQDKSLSKREANASNDLGCVVTIIGSVSGLTLAAYKYAVADRLESAVVFTDAVSSFCAGLASLAALIVTSNPQLAWWVDGFVGMLVAVYTLYSGLFTMLSARHALEEGDDRAKLVDSEFSRHFEYSYQASSPSPSLSEIYVRKTDVDVQQFYYEGTGDEEDEFEVVESRMSIFRSLFSAVSPLGALSMGVSEQAARVSAPQVLPSYSSLGGSDSGDDEITFTA